MCDVRVKRRALHDKILNSASYKAAMEDVRQGRVYKAASVDDMFREIMKEE